MPPDGYTPEKEIGGSPSPEENTFTEYRLAQALSRLAHEIRESRKVSEAHLEWFKNQSSVDFTEKQNKKLNELRGSIESAITRANDEIMSQLSEFSDRVEAKFGEIATSVDGLVTGVTGIDADVQGLKKQIADLQASPGGITLEDQARLDKLEAGLTALGQKTAAAAQSVKDLDAKTADAPPVEPPV